MGLEKELEMKQSTDKPLSSVPSNLNIYAEEDDTVDKLKKSKVLKIKQVMDKVASDRKSFKVPALEMNSIQDKDNKDTFINQSATPITNSLEEKTDDVFKNSCEIKTEDVHFNGQTFECNQCSHVSNTRKDLLKHIKGVHDKIKDFLCNWCDYTTSYKSHLSRHCRRVHKKLET